MLKAIWSDCRAASSAEYALLLAVVGVGLGGAILVLGSNIEAAIGGGGNEVARVTQAAAAGMPGTDWEPPQGSGKGSGKGLPTAPGQNPSPGNGNSQGNQTPGTAPTSPPGKGKGGQN